MFIDPGNTGADGPFLSWSARGTLDGAVPPKAFFLRDGATKTPFAGFETGVVLDIDSLKTGWQMSEGTPGVAPTWKWNPSPSQMLPAPGEDYKRGFSVRCAIGGGKTATWEQSGAAVWNALIGLAPALQQRPAPDHLPVVKITGTKALQFKRGSTIEPVLEVVKWVPRPDSLKEGVTIAANPEPRHAPYVEPAKPAPAAQAASPLAAEIGDDLPF